MTTEIAGYSCTTLQGFLGPPLYLCPVRGPWSRV